METHDANQIDLTVSFDIRTPVSLPTDRSAPVAVILAQTRRLAALGHLRTLKSKQSPIRKKPLPPGNGFRI
jgi:hypothetical protein